MSNTKEELIEYLLELAEKFPDKQITRDFFVSQGKYTRNDIVNATGTFNQLKIEANLKDSKYVKSIENSIAKYVSLDKLRKFNVEKSSYEGKYLKPTGKKYVTTIICSDLHDLKCDTFYLRCLYDTIKRTNCENIILGGDILDNSEFSSHYSDPRNFKLVERLNWLQNFLSTIREISPDSQIDYISGNHEEMLFRHLCNQSPQTMTLLSDFHGHTISSLIGIDKFEINYISRNNLAAFIEAQISKDITRNDIIKYECLHVNHYPDKHPIMPYVNGHHHKYECRSHYNPIYGSFQSIQLGCGHIRHATYCDGQKWNQGFVIADIDTENKRVQFTYIDCTNRYCMIGGKFYERNESEL